MSKRGMEAPLAVQMDQLKKTLQKRDRRRDQDRQTRLVSAAAEDPYAQTARVKPTSGAVALRPGAAAQAAVLNAAALQGPTPIRCELCQADFRNEATLRQHEEGPAHKKALAKEKARLEREAWMENPSAAANALQAATWLNGEEASRRQQARQAADKAALQARLQRQNDARDRGLAAAAGGSGAGAARPKGPSHADLIARARRANEPISIDGWVPPSLDATAAISQDVEESSRAADADFSSSSSGEEEAAAERSNALASRAEDAATRPGSMPGAVGGTDDGAAPREPADGGGGLVAYGISSSSDADDDDSSDSEQPRKPLTSFF